MSSLQQQGLLNRIGNFFSGNPNSQRQVYLAAQQKIQAAAAHSPLLAQAKSNTRGMLTGMLHSLGFSRVTVIFGARLKAATRWSRRAVYRRSRRSRVKVTGRR